MLTEPSNLTVIAAAAAIVMLSLAVVIAAARRVFLAKMEAQNLRRLNNLQAREILMLRSQCKH